MVVNHTSFSHKKIMEDFLCQLKMSFPFEIAAEDRQAVLDAACGYPAKAAAIHYRTERRRTSQGAQNKRQNQTVCAKSTARPEGACHIVLIPLATCQGHPREKRQPVFTSVRGNRGFGRSAVVITLCVPTRILALRFFANDWNYSAAT